MDTTRKNDHCTIADTAHGGCTGPIRALRINRRGFLRDTGVAIAASLLASGLTPSAGFAAGAGEVAAPSDGDVERTYAVPSRDGVWIDATNKVALTRVGRQVFAFSLECPHRGRDLEWRSTEQRFHCPKHQARFTTDGAHVSGRRTSDLDRFPIRMAQGRIVVSVDQVLSADANAAAWSAASVVL